MDRCCGRQPDVHRGGLCTFTWAPNPAWVYRLQLKPVGATGEKQEATYPLGCWWCWFSPRLRRRPRSGSRSSEDVIRSSLNKDKLLPDSRVYFLSLETFHIYKLSTRPDLSCERVIGRNGDAGLNTWVILVLPENEFSIDLLEHLQ